MEISTHPTCNEIYFTAMKEDPPGPFTILEPQDQEIGEFAVVQERRAADFEDLKL